MRVVIATPEFDSVTHWALAQEDVSHEESDAPYGELFASLWNEGEPFILLESDMAPWPGAIERLSKCGYPWCVHRYPVHPANMIVALGIGKYVPRGPAPKVWKETPWHMLEVEVIGYMRGLYGNEHVHEPAIAHVRPELIRMT